MTRASLSTILEKTSIDRPPGAPQLYNQGAISIWWSNILSQYTLEETEIQTILNGDNITKQTDITTPSAFDPATQTYYDERPSNITYPDGTTLDYTLINETGTAGNPILRTGFALPTGQIQLRQNSLTFQNAITPSATTPTFLKQRAVAHEHMHQQHPIQQDESQQHYEERIEQATYNWLDDKGVSLEGYYPLLQAREAGTLATYANVSL